jgi:hypothetical protein
MASTSGSETYPTVVTLTTLASKPKPPAEWENAVKGNCRCGAEVWMHDVVRAALNNPKIIGLCPACAEAERDRQARS